MAPGKRRGLVSCDACGRRIKPNPERTSGPGSAYPDKYYCSPCWKYWEEGD